MPPELRPAVFLDRDGTIIEDRNYLGDPAGVLLLPGAGRAIARLNAAGLPVIIVTNQSGIGRGYFGEADYRSVQARLEDLLEKAGARVDASYHCPHAPDESPPCGCRKPLPGLFERAAEEHGIDLSRSFYVGDRIRDVLPGVRVGGTAFIVGATAPATDQAPSGVRHVRSLEEAVNSVLGATRFD